MAPDLADRLGAAFGFVHRAEHQASLAIELAVVEAGGRAIGLDRRDRLARSGLQIEIGEAARNPARIRDSPSGAKHARRSGNSVAPAAPVAGL